MLEGSHASVGSVSVRNVSLALSKGRGAAAIPIVNDLTFDCPQGQVTVLMGPSGCGKSTTLNIIAGLIRPSAGTISLGGSSQVGYVFQAPSLLPWRTAKQNALLASDIRRTPAKSVDERLRTLFTLCGLNGFEQYYPRHLSGGMQQRTSFVRALLADPSVLLLDEPFINTDSVTRFELGDLVLRLATEQQLAVVMVTHDLMDAVRLGHQVIVLSRRPARVIGTIAISSTISERGAGSFSLSDSALNYYQQIGALRDASELGS